MVTHDPRAAAHARVERHLDKGVLAASVERHNHAAPASTDPQPAIRIPQ